MNDKLKKVLKVSASIALASCAIFSIGMMTFSNAATQTRGVTPRGQNLVLNIASQSNMIANYVQDKYIIDDPMTDVYDVYMDDPADRIEYIYSSEKANKDGVRPKSALDEVNGLFCFKHKKNLFDTHQEGTCWFLKDHYPSGTHLCYLMELEKQSDGKWKYFNKRTNALVGEDSTEQDIVKLFDFCNDGENEKRYRAHSLKYVEPREIDLKDFKTEESHLINLVSFSVPYILTFADDPIKPGDEYLDPSRTAQQALWAAIDGNGAANALFMAAHTVDEFGNQVDLHSDADNNQDGSNPVVTPITFTELETLSQSSARAGYITNEAKTVNELKNGYWHEYTGTVTDGTNYIIGPFKMSDYAYVYSIDESGNSWMADYSGKDIATDKMPNLVGGIEDGNVYFTNQNGGGKTKLTFKDDIDIVYYDNGDYDRYGTSLQSLGYFGVKDKSIEDSYTNQSDKDYIASFEGQKIIFKYTFESFSTETDTDKNEEGVSKVTFQGYPVRFQKINTVTEADGSTYTYYYIYWSRWKMKIRYETTPVKVWGAPPDYKYPWPNSTFYLKIDKSKLTNLEYLDSMDFTYRVTSSQGSGYIYEGKYIRTILSRSEQEDLVTSDSSNYLNVTYYCTTCKNYGLSDSQRSDKTTHTLWCGGHNRCLYGSEGSSSNDSSWVSSHSNCYNTSNNYKTNWDCNTDYHNHSGGRVYTADGANVACGCNHEHTAWSNPGSTANSGCYSTVEDGYKCSATGCSPSSATDHNKVDHNGQQVTCTGTISKKYKQGSLICDHQSGSSHANITSCCTKSHTHSIGDCKVKHKDLINGSRTTPTFEYCDHGHLYGKHNGASNHKSWFAPHDEQCTGTTYCEHYTAADRENYNTSSRYSDIGECMKRTATDDNDVYSSHNHSSSKHTHKHTSCQKCYWIMQHEIEDPQPLASYTEAYTEVKNKTVTTTGYNIRLRTSVEIDKYIVGVRHENTALVTSSGMNTGVYNDGTLTDNLIRRNKADAYKQANPVYLEFGDIVTYNIVLKNNSNIRSMLKINDFLPDENNNYYIDNVKFTYTDTTGAHTKERSGLVIEKNNMHSWYKYDDLAAETWIHMPKNNESVGGNANGTVVVTVSIRVKTHALRDQVRNTDLNLEGLNKSLIITRNTIEPKEQEYSQNHGWTIKTDYDVDYVRRDDITDNTKAIYTGPVVNSIEESGTTKLESSEYFKVNDYNVSVNKSIIAYNDSMVQTNNTASLTNEARISLTDDLGHNETLTYSRYKYSEDDKKNHPLSVEKTESLTYAIKLENLATPVDSAEKSSVKPATQVRVERVEDIIHRGLGITDVYAILYTEGAGRSDDRVTDKNKDTVASNFNSEYDKYRIAVTVDSSKNGNGVYSGKTIADDATHLKYNFDLPKDVIINPNQYLVIYVEAKVLESNMYLYDLDNKATITRLTNINNSVSNDADKIYYVKTDENTTIKDVNNKTKTFKPYDDNKRAAREFSLDYARMKDLVISGKVWVDFDRDGYMNDKVEDYASGDGKASLKKYYNVNDTSMKKDVCVKLYRTDDASKPIRVTYTDENGLFTFSRDNVNNYYTSGYTYYEQYNGSTNYQRIDKANKKDANGNYTADSTYYSYFIEYEYDGVIYKSTVYSGMKNLNNDGSIKTDNKYKTDSNAKEFTSVRNEFNKQYEYITYNAAFDLNKANDTTLTFDKTGHVSRLLEDTSRLMTSRSFITGDIDYNTLITALDRAQNSCGAGAWKSCSNHWKDWQTLISLDIVSAEKYPNTTEGRKAAQSDLKFIHDDLVNKMNNSEYAEFTKTLWLYAFQDDVDNTIPETEYLKYINLGLELREDVDISLSKDVYSVTTTVNGETIEYNFNQNKVEFNGEIASSGKTGTYLKDYVVAKPYGIDLYESDYKMRIEQYQSETVRNYKGIESELNTEVTYRITVENQGTIDDKYVTSKSDQNEKLEVKISEILDLYDSNFIKFTGNNTVTVKEKGEGGFLKDKVLKVAEAWTYVPTTLDKVSDNDVIYVCADSAHEYDDPLAVYAETDKVTASKQNKPIYVKESLTVSNSSNRGDGKNTPAVTKDNNFTNDGFNTLYITGMEKYTIKEGKRLNIYVKYIVDKDKILNEVTNEEVKSEFSTQYHNSGSGKIGNVNYEWHNFGGSRGSTVATYIERSMKILERINSNMKNKFGRGTENFAQINMYSVWYEGTHAPASLVDVDSNAGNIGDINTNVTRSGERENAKITVSPTPGQSADAGSADNVDLYEDTAYKTGVEITADGSENTSKTVFDRYKGINIELNTKNIPKVIRKINGHVWDDSRSTTIGSGKETQYVGDGKFDASIKANDVAKKNEIIPVKYKNGVTEEKDFNVRSVKAEFVEIVQTDPNTYVEQVLQDVSWDQVQHIRTGNDGSYELKGMIPGKYIVRFTYGDSDNVLTGTRTQEQNDMLIFNGQDYKSTQYNSVADNITDEDEILLKLQEANISDARDDEVRRLEVNAYSEIMQNSIAEILKGLANDESGVSGKKNTTGELQQLMTNTYMQAETVEFLVKPEKPENSTTTYKTWNETRFWRTHDPYARDTLADELKDVLYNQLALFDVKDVPTREYVIGNIDFGMEYRPEAEISLTKEISEIKIVPVKDGVEEEPLVHLFFRTEGTGENKKHVVIPEKSIGYDQVQFITNDYKLALNRLDTEKLQGLAYIQIDAEILQGCKVEIVYHFIAENFSEVDRIAKNLDDIRFKNNTKTVELVNSYTNDTIRPNNYKGIVNSERYTASETARNMQFVDLFKNREESDAYGKTNTIIIRNAKKRSSDDGNTGYYGKYVGHGYYTGELSDLDVINPLKFDKILDYIDTDLEFTQKSADMNIKDRYWVFTDTSELTDFVLRVRKETSAYNKATDKSVYDTSTLRNVNGITTVALTDSEGKEYDLVVSVNDRRKDDEYDTNGNVITKENVINEKYSSFLLPNVVNSNASKAYIDLPLSKVLATEEDTKDMQYENIAEIIQYTTLTGRRTNFHTTIGNADITTTKDYNPNSVEFGTAEKETDTAAVETISLTPPTGLQLHRKQIVETVEVVKTGVSVVGIIGAVVSIVFVVTTVAIRKYKKRRIR